MSLDLDCLINAALKYDEKIRTKVIQSNPVEEITVIELHLENTIIAFDGRVIEAFPQGQPASRYHVANVNTAKIETDKKGRQSLQIFMKGGGGFATAQLSPEQSQQAQLLIAEVKKARPDL